MPVIVAFGDSNTWGYDPATGGRFPRAQRWPSVLQRELGADFEVIAEGLNGRTTVHDDPIEPYRNGADALPPCLMSHAPVDLLILSLGCNDLKKRFSVSAFDIAEGAGRLIALARAYVQSPRFVLLDEVSMGLAPLIVDAIARIHHSSHATVPAIGDNRTVPGTRGYQSRESSGKSKPNVRAEYGLRARRVKRGEAGEGVRPDLCPAIVSPAGRVRRIPDTAPTFGLATHPRPGVIRVRRL